MGSCTSAPLQLRQGLDDPNKERVNRFYRWGELTKQTRRRILKRKVLNRKGAMPQINHWQGKNQARQVVDEEEYEWDMPDNGYYTPPSLVADPNWEATIQNDLFVLGDTPAHVGPLPEELEFEKNLRPTRRVVKKKTVDAE